MPTGGPPTTKGTSGGGARDIVENLDAFLRRDGIRPNSVFEMWLEIFKYAMVSSIVIHAIAAIVALCALRKHRVARWYFVIVILMGIIGPATGGAITSAVIAWTYHNSRTQEIIDMPSFFAALTGILQSILCLVISFAKIPATL